MELDFFSILGRMIVGGLALVGATTLAALVANGLDSLGK